MTGPRRVGGKAGRDRPGPLRTAARPPRRSERSRPLNAYRPYYPGFLGALFLVLLRIAIGWHFLSEGLYKYHSTEYGKPFSAEIYLKNAAGPMAPYFRGMLPDPNGLALLDPVRLKASWKDSAERIGRLYGFSDAQKADADKIVAQYEEWADVWFNTPDNDQLRQKYYHDLRKVMEVEQNPKSMTFELERSWDDRKALDADRRTVTGPIVEKTDALREKIAGLAKDEQKAAVGERYGWLRRSVDLPGGITLGLPTGLSNGLIGWLNQTTPTTQLQIANAMTMYGLILIGVCMILGLFTPFASVCGAAFLTLIYLSMPPLEGMPPNPKSEGNYWIVNKNLVELIACLAIATTASGHWVGLDALVFGGRRRRRLARLEAAPVVTVERPVAGAAGRTDDREKVRV